MKCPKCGYTSFDHNDTCPKCLKDMAAERHQLNLPPFTPNPPYLLGLLDGEVGVKKISRETEQMAPPLMTSQDRLAGPEDSQALQAMEMALEADQETQIAHEPPAMRDEIRNASEVPSKVLQLERDEEGVDLMELSLEDLEPPTSLTVEAVTEEDGVEIDSSSDALSLMGDDLADLDDDLLFGEDDTSLDESLDRISDHASTAVFLDDEAALEEGLEGPLDLGQLASMVDSINEEPAPAIEGGKPTFDPSLSIEHMMEDEIMDLDVTLGSRSEKEQTDQSDPVPRLTPAG